MKEILSSYLFDDMEVKYVKETENGQVGLIMLPATLESNFSLEGKWAIDNLVQVKIVGDSYPIAYSQGQSMRNSDSTKNLSYVEQKEKKQVVESGYHKGKYCTQIDTVMKSDKLQTMHSLTYVEGTDYITVKTEVHNISKQPILLEMISSFSNCGFSCLDAEERTQDFNLYRLRSKWSSEGRLIKENFIDLQLEPSWQRSGVQSIRYGEVGSMPVRTFFPWLAVEDEKYGYFFGAQLYNPSSWQMEVFNVDDRVSFSGGIADREFGHFMKELPSGEVFETPKAVLTTACGTVDTVSNRLVSAQKEGRFNCPEVDKDLPIIFNEFCTTWGNPTAENLKKVVGALEGKDIKYCVIDAGWYGDDDHPWYGAMGDWDIDMKKFPGGFTETVKAIKDAGMIPGLWFEFEAVGCTSNLWKNEDYQLKRDGYPITNGIRRFLDMRKPEVIEYLADKVINTLKTYGFGYLKVDYNDNIGIGCDGAESLGEGLRQSLIGTQKFFERIHKELPDLVIENCASGGHRLEPSMQALTSMASFSDAHECIHIPIIAANVQRAILPEQSQIWAVLRAKDDEKRTYYSMINTLLGRMCLSGDIYDLTDKQWSIVEHGMEFYHKVAKIIRDGKTTRQGNESVKYNNPTGYQAVIRECEEQLLIVVHTFYENPAKLEITLPDSKDYKVCEYYGRGQVTYSIHNHVLTVEGMQELEGAAFYCV